MKKARKNSIPYKTMVDKLVDLVVAYGEKQDCVPEVGCNCALCKMLRQAHKLKKLEKQG